MNLRTMRIAATYLDRARGTDGEAFVGDGEKMLPDDAFEWLGERIKGLIQKSESGRPAEKFRRSDGSGLRVVATVPAEEFGRPAVHVEFETAHHGRLHTPGNLFELSERVGLIGCAPYHSPAPLRRSSLPSVDKSTMTTEFSPSLAALNAMHGTIAVVETHGVIA